MTAKEIHDVIKSMDAEDAARYIEKAIKEEKVRLAKECEQKVAEVEKKAEQYRQYGLRLAEGFEVLRGIIKLL